MALENVLYSAAEGIATLTVHRPEKLNALNRKTVEDLSEAFGMALADGAVRVVILTGSGEKAFVAGADIGEIAGLDAQSGRTFALAGQEVFHAIEASPKPVIAAVNGFALGGGCELAMACHVRIASESAQFGQPEVALGVIPGYGGTQRLPRLVGRGIALELLLAGDRIGAQRALDIGLVNAVVPASELMAAARGLAERMAAKSPSALRLCLNAVSAGLDMPLDEGCHLEATLFGLSCATDDKREGTEAFLQKRKPVFSGR